MSGLATNQLATIKKKDTEGYQMDYTNFKIIHRGRMILNLE
jgi:hypothetical protein